MVKIHSLQFFQTGGGKVTRVFKNVPIVVIKEPLRKRVSLYQVLFVKNVLRLRGFHVIAL